MKNMNQWMRDAGEKGSGRQFRIVKPNKSLVVVIIALAMLPLGQLVSAQVLPADAKPTCTVPPGTFAGWFASGSVAANGIVKPANSAQFAPNSNCSFYQWSEQMFLWATSPAPASYKGGHRVFESPVFYDVSDLVNNQRTFIPHVDGVTRRLLLRSAQVGARGTPVIIQNNRLVPLVRPQVGPTGKTLIKDKAGNPVEIGQVKVVHGKPTFLDKAGNPINHQVGKNGKPVLTDRAGKLIRVQSIKIVNGRPVFISSSGQVIDIEQGQAGGSGVLIAQNTQANPLVYYASMVNDVYAYFLTGTPPNSGITPVPTQFPTTQANLTSIQNFAATAPPPFTRTSFPDGIALAVELKTSWMEASAVSNPESYIQMPATIPVYDTSKPELWTPLPNPKTTTLVMVGMHVVGSVQGHPEMIWASFEHFGNSPVGAYNYFNTSGVTVNGPASPGAWLFSMNNASPAPCPGTTSPATFNCELANAATSPNIAASVTGTPIGPSNIQRTEAWGTPSSSSAFTQNNTDIISINNNILGMLLNGDLRKNYYLIGATWTIGGHIPPNATEVGTNKLANSTMETFHQPSNCFDCHQGGALSGLSHIYGPLQPLWKH